jgi:hypothetical protein
VTKAAALRECANADPGNKCGCNQTDSLHDVLRCPLSVVRSS